MGSVKHRRAHLRLHKTEVEGVFTKGQRFIALLYIRGEHRFLGSYQTLEEAAAKAGKLKRAHEGEWAA